MKMNRRVMAFALALAMVAHPAMATENADLASLAVNLEERKTAEGTYEIFGNTQTREKFSQENMAFRVNVPLQAHIVDMILQNSDTENIMEVVQDFNSVYLSSLFSGTFQIYPREHFASEEMYQEANARTLYQMFCMPNVGAGIETYDFQLDIEQLKIRGNVAKVIVKLDCTMQRAQEPQQKISFGGESGYLLKQTDGKWQLENIIFQTDFPNDTFAAYEKSINSDDWKEQYSFENCQRKDYEAPENFRDYLIGSIDQPALNMEMIKLPTARE